MCGASPPGSRKMAFDASDGVAMERAVYPGLIDLSGYPRPPFMTAIHGRYPRPLSTTAIHDPHS